MYVPSLWKDFQKQSKSWVPFWGKTELRPLAVTMGIAFGKTGVWSIHRNTTITLAGNRPMTSLPVRPQYERAPERMCHPLHWLFIYVSGKLSTTRSACSLARGFALIPAVSHGLRVVCVVKSKRVHLSRSWMCSLHSLFISTYSTHEETACWCG